MARQFKPVDRDAEMLLPPSMLDWVPERHAVRVVIGTVERLMTRDLAARLVPPAPKGSAAGPARYDPAMLLTVWMYAYLRGVLSTRAAGDRCRYDATFRVACGRAVPDHTTFSRFRKHLFAQDGLAEELFYRVLRVCACAGLGRLSVVAGDGVKIAANASKEASRTEAGLRRLAARVIAEARRAGSVEDAQRGVLPGTDLLLGADTAPGPDPRSRAGRALACLQDLEGEREAAQAAAREQGRACLEALAAGTAPGPAPAAVAAAAAQLRLETAIAAEEATLAAWQARRDAGQRVTRPPVPPGTGKKARSAGARLEELQAGAARKRGGSRPGTGRPGRGATSPTRTPGCCPSAAAGSPAPSACSSKTPVTTARPIWPPPARAGSSPTARPAISPRAGPPKASRPRALPPPRPTRTGSAPPRAAPHTSAAPPTSRACTPASKTRAASAASASAASPAPPASSCSPA